MKLISKYEGPWGSSNRLFTINTGDWRFQQPEITNEKCRRCSWCAIFCPVGAIHKIEKNFKINLDYCKGCGICGQICPGDAIVMVVEEG